MEQTNSDYGTPDHIIAEMANDSMLHLRRFQKSIKTLRNHGCEIEIKLLPEAKQFDDVFLQLDIKKNGFEY